MGLLSSNRTPRTNSTQACLRKAGNTLRLLIRAEITTTLKSLTLAWTTTSPWLYKWGPLQLTFHFLDTYTSQDHLQLG